MARPAKLNNYEKLIRDLFKRYEIPITRPEFGEFLLHLGKEELLTTQSSLNRWSSAALLISKILVGENHKG
jgi:hypothetical protein